MNRMIKCFKRTYRDFGKFTDKLETVTADEIVKASWQSGSADISLGYLLYRWIQFFLHVAFEMLSLLDVGRRYKPGFSVPPTVKKTAKYYMKWLLYLTHWGLVLNSVQAFVGLWLVQRAHHGQSRRSQSPSPNAGVVAFPDKLTKVYCYLWSTAFHLSTYVTAGFWLLVYDPETFEIDAVTLSEHGLGLVLLFVDMFVSRVPYKMFAGICTILLATFYLLLTYVHHLLHALDRYQDKTYIYEKGDWSHPGVVLIYYLFSVFVMTSFHFSLWGLYLLRRRFTSYLRGQSNPPSPPTTPTDPPPQRRQTQ